MRLTNNRTRALSLLDLTAGQTFSCLESRLSHGMEQTGFFGIRDQSWNRLRNGQPVRSGRLKNSTGPVRPEHGRLESHVQPVKFRRNRLKTGEKMVNIFWKNNFYKKSPQI
jgi:hypothetical protein